MKGLNAITGETIDGLDHLRQSIRDIITTPIGSRIMRREYGSKLLDLIDAPMNPSTQLEIYSAIAEAIEKWEPRFRINKIQLTAMDSDSAKQHMQKGNFTLTLQGEYLPDGKAITLDGLIV